ncbi:hypothetical protein [Plantactinospora soyae]|uniref:Uncharacterized protein n=1 Tax=Plantactinospora soyae TaxID=1544732 RepID=A0A927M8S2_9ACTN|nr:hypothetical protein [Plantactinospora soyae]MBE1489904.1 hypothetical protein [Plantactinospora soyae]
MMVGEGIRSRLRFAATRPGAQTWGGSKLLPGLHRPLGSYPPVLALTVLRESKSRPEILVGVRDPKANRTHQNVASVPTRRVQPAIARSWLWHLRTYRSSSTPGRHDLRDEVANIFSRKLGLSDAQERGEVHFDVEALTAFQGISVIGEQTDGSAVTESLTMFNALVRLRKGDDHVPALTASYNPLVWADIDDFVAMTRTRDTGRLNAGLEDSFFCAYGLCLQTSAKMLAASAEVRRL